MAKIHELSTILSDQIAAGEVIERPASVVKELVENAIDAHSTQIDIRIKDAGLQMIQVTDNGEGIISDELPLAFKRHSTSKIATRNDLFKVKSLGFRGEALASIAAIADVTLTSATANEPTGSCVHIKGGKILNQQSVAVRQGTTVEVKDLFFNTPARLKYLRSYQTELSKIVDIVNRLAMGHTDIAFSLINDQNLMLKTTGRHNLSQTVANIYGISIAKKMLPISGADLDFKIDGLVSLPEVTRASRNYISLLINGRYIKNFQLNKALIAGYGSKLMIGRFPIAVINIQMDPLLVDANVHPTKQEVRLSKEDALGNLLTNIIRQKLATLNLIPDALRHQPVVKPQITSSPDINVDTQTQQLTIDEATSATDDVALAMQLHEDDQLPINDAITTTTATYHTASTSQPRFPQLRYLAQVHGTYLLAEAEDGLYLLDQHAAQERIKYEFYREEIGKVSNAQQNLLVPIIIDYANNDALILHERLPLLRDIGIYLEPFGQNSFILRTHPAWFPENNVEATVREMIDEILQKGKLTVAEFREKTAIMISCRTSIKANHHLEPQQAQALLDDLAKTANPFNCPHGRPTLVKFSNKDLEKMFKRIQDPHDTRDAKIGD
ncbi:MAG: DNA mismatch repair endonuclease MutL [Candidatus Paralactobacillus gallistercoris]|uniref:DNA mismatch repair protein MutL n=1 Tax=Candidatus Paralactobacillus gallistercoris TaxID=2838724 RepID=A0A948X1D0_9LACO|nr:DNA mismatch repair endonuclease MutL [Candidatus Paralactobacillus gallistercoris]